MTILEKEILFIISRLRCLTENQFNKLFNYKRDSKKKTLRRTLRRMCNDYILVKFPCNINYRGYKENSYLDRTVKLIIRSVCLMAELAALEEKQTHLAEEKLSANNNENQ